MSSTLPYKKPKIPLKNKSKYASKKQNMNRKFVKVHFLGMFAGKSVKINFLYLNKI